MNSPKLAALPLPSRSAAITLATGLTLSLFAVIFNEAQAQGWHTGERRAEPSIMVRVLSATPNLDRISETRQQCHYETQQVPVTTAGSSGTGGAILGALAGGLLASQVGKGTGKHVAIAAGSATGAMIGKNMAEQPGSTNYVSQQIQVCRPLTQQREQVRDYTVRYEYQGQEYTVNLPQHPGQWLKLTVSHGVSPV